MKDYMKIYDVDNRIKNVCSFIIAEIIYSWVKGMFI